MRLKKKTALKMNEAVVHDRNLHWGFFF